MIPFEELVATLERYKRRKAGEPVGDVGTPVQQRSNPRRGAEAAELAVDELLDEL